MAKTWVLHALLVAATVIALCQDGWAQQGRPRGELQPGVGEMYVPPPPIPPMPESFQAVEKASQIQADALPIVLEELEDLACHNNPTLMQARAQVEGQLGKAIEAGLWPNPRLFYIQEQIGVQDTPGEFLGGAVRQEIVTGRKLDLSRTIFLERTRTAEWVAMAQQYRVLNDVRMHYFRTLAMQEIIGVQRELLKNSEDGLVTLREMYNLGQAIRADLHKANAQLQEQRLKVLMAENDFRHAWQTLTAFVGLDLPLRPLAGPLETNVSPIEWDQALNRLIAEAPQLQAARAKLRSDEVRVKREIVEPIPNIFVQAGAGHNYEAEESVGLAEVFLDVPLFDWNQGAIRQAEADMVRQRGEIRRIELLLRMQLAEQYRAYLTALQHVRNYQEVILPEARKAYEVMLDSYEDDRAPWIQVLEFEREYFLRRLVYLQNLMLLRQTEVLIIGYLLHDGLEAPVVLPPGHIEVFRGQNG